MSVISNLTYTSESAESSDDGSYSRSMKSGIQRRTRQPKSFSRNAQIARENRRKKKIYIENLEKEVARMRARNKKLDAILKEQANVMQKQEGELKYLKAILANSADICNILRTVHTNTGMSVGTSLDKRLCLKRKAPESLPPLEHPWTDDFHKEDSLLTDTDFFNLSPLLDDGFNEVLSEPASLSPTNTLEDHTYTMPSSEEDKPEDAGICLHVSKSRVALEFCSTCNDNANRTWHNLEGV